MNEWYKLTRLAPMYQEMYPAGTRIMLEQMGDDPRPVPSGTRGTVRVVDDLGTVHCDFDNGRHLGLVPGEDHFRKLTARELEEEGRKPSLADQIKNADARAAAGRAGTDVPERDPTQDH